MTRTTSPDGIGLIKQREGVRLVPYQDTNGTWTDGVGNTHGVVPHGPAITMDKVDADLRRNLGAAEAAINARVTVALSQNQFDALVSLVFNIGERAFAASTLLKKLNAGDYAAVSGEMMKWNKETIGGKLVPNPGLSNRRASEAGQWARSEFVASATVEVATPPKPISTAKAMRGPGTASIGTVGTMLTDTASQFKAVADYSQVLRTIFVVLICAGIALGAWDHMRQAKAAA